MKRVLRVFSILAASVLLAQDYNVPYRPRVAGSSPPTLRAVGAVDAGIAAVSPGLPAGTAAGDLLIILIATAAQTVTVSGWTQAPSSPQTTGSAQLTVFYKTAVGGDSTTTSDSGAYQLARIIGITAGTWNTSAPFNTNSGNVQSSATTGVSITGATTSVNNCLVVAMSAGNAPDANGTAEFSSPANASLTGVTEQVDNITNASVGGAIFALTGTMTTAGTYGASTTTAVNQAVRGNISLAVAPAP